MVYNRMRYFVFSVFCVNLACSSIISDVRKMKVNDAEQILRSQIPRSPTLDGLSHQNIFDVIKSQKSPELLPSSKLGGNFKWKKCNNHPSLLSIEELSNGPDPLHFPGDIYVQFTAAIKETVDAPLQMNVTLKKEITPTFWLEIPCINGIGSCSYDDFCDNLALAVCPNQFVEHDIPCKCPFRKGAYKMPKSAFRIPISAIPVGNYYAKTDITYKDQLVSCLEITFAVGGETP